MTCHHSIFFGSGQCFLIPIVMDDRTTYIMVLPWRMWYLAYPTYIVCLKSGGIKRVGCKSSHNGNILRIIFGFLYICTTCNQHYDMWVCLKIDLYTPIYTFAANSCFPWAIRQFITSCGMAQRYTPRMAGVSWIQMGIVNMFRVSSWSKCVPWTFRFSGHYLYWAHYLYWSTQIVVCCLQHFVGLNHFSNDTWRSYIARPIVRWRTKPPTLNEKRTLLGSRAVPSVFRFDKHPGRKVNWQAFCGRVLEWSPLSLFQVELECVCVIL